jgi:hypothetical protein
LPIQQYKSMTFLKYIFEVTVILYIVRFVMRFIDNAFATKPIQNQQTPPNSFVNTNQTNSQTKPKAPDEDYIEYEEIK